MALLMMLFAGALGFVCSIKPDGWYLPEWAERRFGKYLDRLGSSDEL